MAKKTIVLWDLDAVVQGLYLLSIKFRQWPNATVISTCKMAKKNHHLLRLRCCWWPVQLFSYRNSAFFCLRGLVNMENIYVLVDICLTIWPQGQWPGQAEIRLWMMGSFNWKKGWDDDSGASRDDDGGLFCLWPLQTFPEHARILMNGFRDKLVWAFGRDSEIASSLKGYTCLQPQIICNCISHYIIAPSFFGNDVNHEERIYLHVMKCFAQFLHNGYVN